MVIKRMIASVMFLIICFSSSYAGDVHIGVISVLKNNIEKLKNMARPLPISMIDGRWTYVPDSKGSTGTVTPTTNSLTILII